MALFLKEQGYRASALRGGFDGWKAARLPLEEMSKEMDLQNEAPEVKPIS